MNLSAVKVGDVVEVEMRGWRFLAKVEERLIGDKNGMDLRILPANKNVTHHHCAANDVKAHYKLMGRPRGRPKKGAELDESFVQDEEAVIVDAPFFEEPVQRDPQEGVENPVIEKVEVVKDNPFLKPAPKPKPAAKPNPFLR